MVLVELELAQRKPLSERGHRFGKPSSWFGRSVEILDGPLGGAAAGTAFVFATRRGRLVARAGQGSSTRPLSLRRCRREPSGAPLQHVSPLPPRLLRRGDRAQ